MKSAFLLLCLTILYYISLVIVNRYLISRQILSISNENKLPKFGLGERKIEGTLDNTLDGSNDNDLENPTTVLKHNMNIKTIQAKSIEMEEVSKPNIIKSAIDQKASIIPTEEIQVDSIVEKNRIREKEEVNEHMQYMTYAMKL